MANTNSPQDIKKDSIRHYFFWITISIEIILTAFTSIIIFFRERFALHMSIYEVIGICLITLWIGVLIAYYAWAIYFYNINLGLTDSDWEKIEASRATDNPMTDREDNPHNDQSLGLPPGTVRGTIALTLLVGILAMTLVLFGEGSRLKDNEIFIDNFDFFKTAFLMMIAFYFGNKSLEYLLPKNGKTTPTPSQSEITPTITEPTIPKDNSTTVKVDNINESGNGAQG